VEYDSSMGYVTSTPSSNPTAIIGIIENPTMKQNRVVSHAQLTMKLKATPTVLRADRIEMIMTDNLYVFLISTHTPNTAEPTIPPIINTAPKSDALSYGKIYHR